MKLLLFLCVLCFVELVRTELPLGWYDRYGQKVQKQVVAGGKTGSISLMWYEHANDSFDLRVTLTSTNLNDGSLHLGGEAVVNRTNRTSVIVRLMPQQMCPLELIVAPLTGTVLRNYSAQLVPELPGQSEADDVVLPNCTVIIMDTRSKCMR